MNIRKIVEQITALEAELGRAIEAQEERLTYRVKDHRIVFESSVKEAHQRVKQGILSALLSVRPQNFLTMPIIYGMVIPLVLFDLFVSVYQLLCFPIYQIPRVSRASYIVMDHQHLAYLNIIEKFHCMYCSYAVGMLAYTGEIIARTEQYFCPIKHAKKVNGSHSRYSLFLDYGDADQFHKKMNALRAALNEEIQAEEKR